MGVSLADIATTDFFKGLIYGDSGAGKTCFAASAPLPIRYWDFDHKISSAAKHYSAEPERLQQIDVTQFAALPVKNRIPEFDRQMQEIAALVRDKKPLPFKTLVLDSLTTFTASLLNDYLTRSQLGIKRAIADIPAMQDYQLLDKHLSLTIPSLLSLDCHVIMTGHMKIEKDETTGQILRIPLMPGQFANKLMIYFEEAYVAKVDAKGQFVLQTQTDGTYKCRSQRKLAKEVPTKWSEVFK